MSYFRQHRKLIAEYRALGWTVESTGKGHVRWRSPEGAIVIASTTPSDHRSDKNHRARLKRGARPPKAR